MKGSCIIPTLRYENPVKMTWVHCNARRAIGGISQIPDIIVYELDAICERAHAACTEISMEPKDDADYGGRVFSC